MKCTGCAGADPNYARPQPTNQNAPWVLQGKLRRNTALGTVSAGFVGTRNLAVPLSTVMPIGGEVDLGPLGRSSSVFAGPSSQWSFTAGVEKTFLRFGRRATIGITADVMLPLATQSRIDGDPRIGAMSSSAARVGIVIRW